jgi:hypothetical protein
MKNLMKINKKYSNSALYVQFSHIILLPLHFFRVTRYRSWFRHCATSRKVTGSIPNEVIGIFIGPNPSSRAMADTRTHGMVAILAPSDVASSIAVDLRNNYIHRFGQELFVGNK